MHEIDNTVLILFYIFIHDVSVGVHVGVYDTLFQHTYLFPLLFHGFFWEKNMKRRSSNNDKSESATGTIKAPVYKN